MIKKKWIRPLSISSIVIILGGISGCSGYIPPLLVLRANYNVSRGEYQTAVVDYLRASGNSEYDAWISYNLGNVYHALGENEGAVEMWERSRQSDAADLLFGASFNRGVYAYERGLYDEALAQFRTALEVAPSSLAAKRNYELALEKLRAEEEIGEAGEAGDPVNPIPDQSGNRILDYVGRKEEQRWRANAERSVEPGVQDW
jgi:tetratricopeptide (TPR) repeat protein